MLSAWPLSPGEEHIFTAMDDGDSTKLDQAVMAPKELVLKVGAVVMSVVTEQPIRNGDRGVVLKIDGMLLAVFVLLSPKKNQYKFHF